MSSHHSKEHHNNTKHGQTHHQRFPIVKPGLSVSNPQFPYRDARHYVDPCCDFPKNSQYGYTAQLTLKEPHPALDNCHSPELPTSHPWFEPSSP